jgi:tetratricopeptide (TPR) repeat protein
MGEVYAGLGDYPIAEIHLSRALTIRRTARPVDESELAQSLVGLADVWIKLGREPKARALLEEAVEIQRRLHRTLSLARSLALQARAVRADVSDTTRLAVAEALYLEALEVLDMLEAGRTDSVPEDHPVLASTLQGTLLPESLNGLADVIAEQGREAEAEPLYDQARAAYDELSVDQNGSNVARALCLAELAVSAGRRGRGESAATSLAEALVVLEGHLGVEHPYTLRVLAQHGQQVAINARAAPGGSGRP